MINQLRIYNDNNNNNHTKYLLDLITNIFGKAVPQFWCRSQEVQSFCYFFLKMHLIYLTHGHITCTLQVKHKKASRKKKVYLKFLFRCQVFREASCTLYQIGMKLNTLVRCQRLFMRALHWYKSEGSSYQLGFWTP